MFIVHVGVEEIGNMNFLLIVLLLLSAFVLSQNQTKRNEKLVFLLVLLMSMIIATRDIKVPDTEGYVEWFLKDYGIFDFTNSPYEKGYTIFSRLFHMVFGDFYQLYFAFIPLLNFYLLSKTSKIICSVITPSKRAKVDSIIVPFNIFFLFIAYFSYYGIYHNAIILRAGVATSLLILSLAFFLRNNNIKDIIESVFYFLLALSFHTSVLVCIPMFWLVRHNLNITNALYKIILIGIFSIYLLSPYLNVIMDPINQLFLVLSSSDSSELSKFEYYDGSSTFVSDGISFKFLYFYLFGWIFFINKTNNHVYNRFMNIYIVGLLVWAIFRPVLWVERITDFYTFFYVILIMVFVAQNRKKPIVPVFVLLASFVQLVFIYRIIYS